MVEWVAGIFEALGPLEYEKMLAIMGVLAVAIGGFRVKLIKFAEAKQRRWFIRGGVVLLLLSVAWRWIP